MERAYEDFTLVQRSLHFPPRDVYYMTNEEMVRFPQFTDLVRRYEQSKEVEAAAAAWEAGAAARDKIREHDSRRKRNRRIDVDSDDREALRTFASTHIPGSVLPATPEGLRERACYGSPTTAKEAGVDLRDLLQSIEEQVNDACPPIARDALAALEVPIRQSSGHGFLAVRNADRDHNRMQTKRPLSSVCGKRARPASGSEGWWN
jgi:hypothetical protein